MQPGEVLDDHLIEKSLGEGVYGNVYKVLHKTSNTKMALKVAKGTKNADDLVRFNNENKILHKLKSHEHILEPLSGVIQSPPDISYYTMELADTDLLEVLQNNPDSGTLFRFFKEICIGLKHAHDAGIAHRDLHWKNILLKLDAVKLTDFGKAKDFSMEQLTKTSDPCWGGFVMPPECSFKIWDSPAINDYIIGDMYALGIILFSFFGEIPHLYLTYLRSQISLYLRSKPLLETLSPEERIGIYTTWTESIPKGNSELSVQLDSQQETDAVNLLLKRLTSIDYRKRYTSIDEIQAEMVGLGL